MTCQTMLPKIKSQFHCYLGILEFGNSVRNVWGGNFERNFHIFLCGKEMQELPMDFRKSSYRVSFRFAGISGENWTAVSHPIPSFCFPFRIKTPGDASQSPSTIHTVRAGVFCLPIQIQKQNKQVVFNLKTDLVKIFLVQKQFFTHRQSTVRWITRVSAISKHSIIL